MTIETLADRVKTLENELAQLKQQVAMSHPPPVVHRWEKIIGTFANSEGFEEAVRLGREYRESLRPSEEEETA